MLGIALGPDCPVLNTPLKQLSELFSTLRAIVVGVRREGHAFRARPGDQLFEGTRSTSSPTRSMWIARWRSSARRPRPPERVIVIGGGNVGLSVARTLENQQQRIRSRVIEANRTRAEVAADALERTIVLHGDGLDMELLREAGVERTDAVLCVTDDDKTNLLASVRAKSAGAHMAIALVNDPTLVPLMGRCPSTPTSIRAPPPSVPSCAISGTAACAASIPSAMRRPR
jgi:trk system potassium uptake protein TrkA